MTYVILTEQELAIEIAHFNIIVVCAVNSSFGSTTNTHQRKCLNVFTTKSSCTHHESFYFTKFFLDITTKDLDLIVVSAISRISINFSLGNRFKNVVVQPLLQWAVLASELYNFLSDNTPKESSLGTDRTCRVI